MRPLDEASSTARSREDSSHCYSKIAGTKSSRKTASSKSRKIPGVSNPADLGTKSLDGGSTRRPLERCHCYIHERRAGIALRADVQEITKSHPVIFTVDHACKVDTPSESKMESEQYWSREQRCSETETAERPNGVNPP